MRVIEIGRIAETIFAPSDAEREIITPQRMKQIIPKKWARKSFSLKRK